MNLIQKIKQKKEFKNLSDKVIKKSLYEYLKKNALDLRNLNEKDEKIIIKEIRAELRYYSGQFQKSSKNRLKIIENNSLDLLLKTHSSTSERIDFYPKLISIINSLNVKSILDLGCGLNPLALASRDITYLAVDIKEDELFIIKEFFKKNKINGETLIYDLRDFAHKDFIPVDLTILFKVLDILEKKSHKLANKIVNTISSKYILVSFATKKLSGKNMNFPQRPWFLSILRKNKLKYKSFANKNEIFYLIEKNISPA